MVVSVEGFTIVELIGSGGYSHVYRAHQRRFDREVALKVLLVGVENAVQQQAFERECRAMGSLSRHPNIVTVFDAAFSEEGLPCIVMEYYSGRTLGDRMEAEGPLGVGDVLKAGIEVAGALSAAHDLGICHRDIKPKNVFVSEFGSVALGDFGISSFDGERTVTGGGGMTVHYAPPELIEGESASVASDVYSLAATLYTLLAGRRPFPRGPNHSDADIIRRILMEPAPRLNAEGAPSALADLLHGAMAKDPDIRPGSAAEFGERLQAIESDSGRRVTPLLTPLSGPVSTEPRDPTSRNVVHSSDDPPDPWSGPGNRRLTAAALAGLALASLVSMVTAGAVLANRDDGERVMPDARASTRPMSAPVATDDPYFAAPPTPDRIAMSPGAPGTVLVSWQSTGSQRTDTGDSEVSYEVQLVGANANASVSDDPVLPHVTTETSLTLDVGQDADTVCVVVRAVGRGGRLSADSVPVCSAVDVER